MGKVKFIGSVFIIVMMFLLTMNIWSQCAMCKATVESSAQGQNLAKKLNSAILLLLSAPYIVFGTSAYIIYKKSKTGSNNT